MNKFVAPHPKARKNLYIGDIPDLAEMFQEVVENEGEGSTLRDECKLVSLMLKAKMAKVKENPGLLTDAAFVEEVKSLSGHLATLEEKRTKIETAEQNLPTATALRNIALRQRQHVSDCLQEVVTLHKNPDVTAALSDFYNIWTTGLEEMESGHKERTTRAAKRLPAPTLTEDDADED